MATLSCSMTLSATPSATAITSRRFQRMTSLGTASSRRVNSWSQRLRARTLAFVSTPSTLMSLKNLSLSRNSEIPPLAPQTAVTPSARRMSASNMMPTTNSSRNAARMENALSPTASPWPVPLREPLPAKRLRYSTLIEDCQDS